MLTLNSDAKVWRHVRCMTRADLRAVDVPRAAGAGDVSRAAGRVRLGSVDLLRGLVMLLMALDHTRDFFAASGPNPRDIADPALFLTRWVTHFCAPTFIFLAGVSAFLYGERGRRIGEVSWFLLTRGLWLILIEFTLMRLCWTFSIHAGVFVMQVIWVTGASMVVLAALVHLPRWAIATIGLAMIAGHNLLDGIDAEELGQGARALEAAARAGADRDRAAHQAVRALRARAVVGGDGGGLRRGAGVQARSGIPSLVLAADRRRRHRWLYRAAGHQSLRRPGRVERASERSRHGAVVHRLRKVSAFAAVFDDDARARADPARAVRARPWRARRRRHHVRARAVLLLRGARRIHPRACRGVRLDRRGRYRLDVRRVPIAKARELRARPSRRLRRLALRAGRALSALPRLCGAQAPAARMVVELPLRDEGSTAAFGGADMHGSKFRS